jgi:hypothetical protein
MKYDFAILYFGLTRSVRKTHESHKKHIVNILQKENLTYKTFMHTWKTRDNTQNVWETVIPQKIDYDEYTLLYPDEYTLDDENAFLDSLDMDTYFYKHIWEQKGESPDGEWLPRMVSNHLCMLESQKRAFSMVNRHVEKGDTFTHILLIRPDITIYTDLPVHTILAQHDKVHIPNHSHHGGANDQLAILNYEDARMYANRIDEIADYRKTQGRIAGETYCKFILNKYKMNINEIDFKYCITRP